MTDPNLTAGVLRRHLEGLADDAPIFPDWAPGEIPNDNMPAVTLLGFRQQSDIEDNRTGLAILVGVRHLDEFESLLERGVKPWHSVVLGLDFEGEALDEDELERLWETCEPSDFIFGFYPRKEFDDARRELVPFGTGVGITPRQFFVDENEMFDQPLQLRTGLLPDYLHETSEGLYDITPGGPSVEEIRADLIARGFKESDSFSTFLEEHND